MLSQTTTSNTIKPPVFKPIATWTKLGIYGPPSTGKTGAIAALAEAGHKIVFINTQNNLGPLIAASPEAQARVTMVNIWDTPSVTNLYAAMVKLYQEYKFRVCEAHGVVNCGQCSKSGDPVIQFAIEDVPRDAILVVDAFSDIVQSATYAVYNKLAEATAPGTLADFSQKAEWDVWGGIGNALAPIIGFLTKIPRHMVIVSHAKDTAKPAAKGDSPPPFFAFNAGTRNKSQDVMSQFGYMWLTQLHQKPIYEGNISTRAFVTSRGRETEFKGKPLNEAVVQLFAPLLNDDGGV